MKKYEYIYAYQIGQYPDWEIVELIKNDNKISESGLIIAKEDKIINDKEQEIERLNNIINELEERISNAIEMLDNEIFLLNNYYTLDFEFKFKEYREDIKNKLLGSDK